MASRRAITKAQAVRYRSGSGTVNSEILHAACAVTGFNRDYARRALKAALTPPAGEAPDPEAAEVRREGCRGTGESAGRW